MRNDRVFFILLITFFVMAPSIFAVVQGNTYTSDKYGCTLTAQSGWKVDASETKNLVSFKSYDGVSEVSLDVVPLTGKKGLKDVANEQAGSYDGWVFEGAREGTSDEIYQANVSGKIVASFTKQILSDTGQAAKVIVAEEYMVKGKYVYVLTSLTEDGRWWDAKADINTIRQSFRVN